MDGITRYDPALNARDLIRLATPTAFSPGSCSDRYSEVLPINGLKMKLEVSEDDRSRNIKADIPGVKKEECRKLVPSERYFGRVSRSFALDKEMLPGEAGAKYTDGVLEAVPPKNQDRPQMKLRFRDRWSRLHLIRRRRSALPHVICLKTDAMQDDFDHPPEWRII